ncbi:MAG: carbohydrate kinase family protein [Candidatus Baldrarchaeia archaeon]
MYDVAVLGHIVMDEIERGDLRLRSIGGAATYSTLAAKTYGANTLLVSKIGKDFPEDLLSLLIEKGIDLACVKRVPIPTTKFKLIYKNDERVLFLMERCEPILPNDLCQLSFQAKIFHIGCVINEVPLQTLKQIRSKNKYISLDIQGYVRKIDETGRVKFTEWNEAKHFLKLVNIVHADADEARIITKAETPSESAKILVEMGAEIALITLGEKGSYVGTEKEVLYIPAAKPNKIVDSTGAGDVYTIIFTLEYLASLSVKWAGAVASAAASFIVESPGPTGFSNKDSAYRRAKTLMDHIKEVT